MLEENVNIETRNEGEMSDLELRDQVARAVYLGMYENDGGQWEAVETREHWFKIADRCLSLISAARKGQGEWAETCPTCQSREVFWKREPGHPPSCAICMTSLLPPPPELGE